jgi:hypothetical protein
MDADGQVFSVRFSEAKGIKLTAKPKALDKPFGKTIIEPFLKWWNTKHEDDTDVTLDDLEEVVLEGSSAINLSATVRTVVQGVESSDDPGGTSSLSVEVHRRKERQLVFALAGIELPMTISPKFVQAPLSLYAFPEFLRTVNSQYGVEIQPREVAQVRREGSGPHDHDPSDVSDADAVAQMDLSAPAFKVLPRDGPPTRIYVVLTPDVTKRVKSSIPQLASEYEAPRGGEPGVFRVKCDTVELKLTLPPAMLAQPLREGIIKPFLKEYARKTSVIAEIAAVASVKVDGLATGVDASCSSFVLAGKGVVRVELTLDAARTRNLWDEDDYEEEPKPKPMELPPEVEAELAKARATRTSRYAKFL